MIKITKTQSDTPAVLLGRGKEEIERLKKMGKDELLSYSFSSSLYGSKTVKNKLKAIQNDKCCFCESKVSAISHGDVEHYRPKAGWMQDNEGPIIQPGYYWLAFDFNNLFMSCQLCNQVYKKNFFPLVDPNRRAKDHTYNLDDEEALIIDPSQTDPSLHLEFRKEVVLPKTRVGEETIKRTGLNRKELMDQRYEYLKLLETVSLLALQNNDEGKAALKQLKELSSKKCIYSLMVYDNFKNLFA